MSGRIPPGVQQPYLVTCHAGLPCRAPEDDSKVVEVAGCALRRGLPPHVVTLVKLPCLLAALVDSAVDWGLQGGSQQIEWTHSIQNWIPASTRIRPGESLLRPPLQQLVCSWSQTCDCYTALRCAGSMEAESLRARGLSGQQTSSAAGVLNCYAPPPMLSTSLSSCC